MATKQKEKRIQKEKKTTTHKAALFIPAGLLLGIGCGIIFKDIVAGTFIGLGAGMVTYAILAFIKK